MLTIRCGDFWAQIPYTELVRLFKSEVSGCDVVNQELVAVGVAHAVRKVYAQLPGDLWIRTIASTHGTQRDQLTGPRQTMYPNNCDTLVLKSYTTVSGSDKLVMRRMHAIYDHNRVVFVNNKAEAVYAYLYQLLPQFGPLPSVRQYALAMSNLNKYLDSNRAPEPKLAAILEGLSPKEEPPKDPVQTYNDDLKALAKQLDDIEKELKNKMEARDLQILEANIDFFDFARELAVTEDMDVAGPHSFPGFAARIFSALVSGDDIDDDDLQIALDHGYDGFTPYDPLKKTLT